MRIWNLLPLPIDAELPAVLEHLRHHSSLVVQASPGAGKTTRVPAALLDAGMRQVLVLEPRRIAARMAARHVAAAWGEAPGKTVGYQVRFEEVAGPETRLRFLTEGVLTRRMMSGPDLRGIDAVVLDEFHERHLEGDVALALLRRLQKTSRPDLRLVVMSATLDAAPVAAFLGGCRILTSQVRQFPLQIEYTPESAQPLEQRVASAVERLIADGGSHILVFLPGSAEIRRANTACESLAARHGVIICPLHGDLTPEEQDRAVSPSGRRKLILSTNVAESSITIEGVTAVIDSGLARVARQSAWSGLPLLALARISQAAADQRAGRAGRTGPGRVIRLYPREDFVRRPAHDDPEILRAELAATALQLHGMGLRADGLEWLTPPSAASLEAAEDLLQRLAALDAGRLTERGHEMARLPLHPRLGRLVMEAVARGVPDDGCAVAAALAVDERLPREPRHGTRSDLLAFLDADLPPRSARVERQLRRAIRAPRQHKSDEDALLLAVLAAFPDRVARRRAGPELLLSSGGAARLSPSSTVTAAEFLVAAAIEERTDREAPLVHLASAIEPEWLVELFPDRLREEVVVDWNRTTERVEEVTRLLYDGLTIEERRRPPGSNEAAGLLAQKAMEAGLARFGDADAIEEFLARAAFASDYAALPRPGPDAVRAAIEHLAHGLASLTELERACDAGGLLRAIASQLPPGSGRLLDEVAPERIRLRGGRNARVRYAPGKPPWIASRLQDFFGMRETPRVARGQVPVVVELLAPNQRPVQTTTDLAGFWQRLYPSVRRELARRYPRHAWPEDPLA